LVFCFGEVETQSIKTHFQSEHPNAVLSEIDIKEYM